MKSKTGKPDFNRGKKLVIPAKTRSPLEAVKMLRAGQPIDQMAGYYAGSGILEKDFYMMDDIDKLHALAGYRELMAIHKKDIERLQEEAKTLTDKTESNEK